MTPIKYRCRVCRREFDSFRSLNGHQNAHRGPVQARKNERRNRMIVVPTMRCFDFINRIDKPTTTKTGVLEAVRETGITLDEFTEMDERPAKFDGRYGDRYWHQILRLTRNDPDNNLFDLLNANKEATSV